MRTAWFKRSPVGLAALAVLIQWAGFTTACSSEKASDDGQGGPAPSPTAGGEAGGPASTGVQGAIQFASGADVAFGCDATEAVLKEKKAIALAHGNATLYLGYAQVSSGNKNPVVARFDGGEKTWCRDDHESTGDDSTAYAAAWNGKDALYVAYSSTGTQGDASADFRRYATGGWLKNYGAGGGAKISVLARMDAANGDVRTATFVSSFLATKGKTNSLKITGLEITSDAVTIKADSASAPRRADTKPMECSQYPKNYRLTLSPDLSKATDARAENCQ